MAERGPEAAGAAPVQAARLEALIALVRVVVLLFSATSIGLREPAVGVDPEVQDAAVLAHLVVAALWAAAVVPLGRLRSAQRLRQVAVGSTVLDVALFAAYGAVLTGEQGLTTLYGVLALLVGPLRWGLPGVVATGVPVGLTSVLWPMADSDGTAPEGLEVLGLVLLLSLPVAGLSVFWRRTGVRLHQAHELFEAAFEGASIGMALLDERLVVKEGNAALAGMLGVPVESLAGTAFPSWVAEEDRDRAVEALQALTASPHAVRLEVRFDRPDGEQRWGLLAASWLAGTRGVPPRLVAQVENVTERKSAEQRLAHQALHDELTGLPNRSLLRLRLDHALAQGQPTCLLFLDVDRFKVVNDGLGHGAGDRLLVSVAQRLHDAARPGDLVARMGGDEFVLLAQGVHDEGDALGLAQRVLGLLRLPVRVDEAHELIATASIGVALAGPGSTPDALLRNADTAMYDAKAAGGSCVRLFTPDLHAQALRAHELEVDLRQALLEDQLHVAYQPQVDLTTGRVVELEALVRWTHPVRGPVDTQEFVTVAEESGLVDELGAWVLRHAAEEAVGWPAGRAADPPVLAVNVSLRQLLDPRFPVTVADVLLATGLPARRLCLEVTETALVADTATVVPALQALRELGVRLSIDDFGTGHASLTYLAQFPVDAVKVDRSFVRGVADEAGSAAIVGGVVAMAGAFGLDVVAEGVESQEQLEQLRRLGVHRAQGYLLARPMGAGALLDVLDAAAAVPAPRRAEPAPSGSEGLDTARRFRVLLDCAREVTALVDLDAVLARSFAALRRFVDFTGGSIQLVDGEVIRLAATDPPATPEALSATIPLGQGVGGTIAVTGEPRYLPDITIASSVTAQRRSKSSSHGVRSWYGVPLVAEGRIIGVLQVDSTEVDAFSEADRLLVLSFASVVASAVQASRLFQLELDALHPPGA